MLTNKHKYSEQEAYTKLSALCAFSEYCCEDIHKKIKKWELSEDAEERILNLLVKEKFIDEQRYAHAFVRDKFHNNHWGRVRIEHELRMRKIAQAHIDDALTEIEPDDNLSMLKEIINKKRPSLKGKNEYEIKSKVIRFALGRGFSMDDIERVLNS